MHEIGTLSSGWLLIVHTVKVVVVFVLTLLTVAILTLAERRISAFIQDRLGPNRVGPQGLLQPITCSMPRRTRAISRTSTVIPTWTW